MGYHCGLIYHSHIDLYYIHTCAVTVTSRPTRNVDVLTLWYISVTSRSIIGVIFQYLMPLWPHTISLAYDLMILKCVILHPTHKQKWYHMTSLLCRMLLTAMTSHMWGHHDLTTNLQLWHHTLDIVLTSQWSHTGDVTCVRLMWCH
jgi:hypothetical protein